jgi:plastocyanin
MRAFSIIFAFLAVSRALTGAELEVRVLDAKGKPVEDAVVWLEAAKPNPGKPAKFEITQKDRQFTPQVTVIPIGSTVSFPNRDNVQHHVYSFSPAKKFDIPLYIGDSPESIRFETAGIVTLGCNIHDWMAAYVLVLETENYGKSSGEGLATVKAAGAEAAKLLIWHPRLRGEPVEAEVRPGQVAEVKLNLKPAFRRTPPEGGKAGYR